MDSRREIASREFFKMTNEKGASSKVSGAAVYMDWVSSMEKPEQAASPPETTFFSIFHSWHLCKCCDVTTADTFCTLDACKMITEL